MKTVFSNSEIFHKFNEQSQYEGKNSARNIYFYNDKIYSYGNHYLLAQFLDDNTILINDTGYSNTTSKHISQITSATRNRKQFFTTQSNTDLVFNKSKDLINKISKARKESTLNHYENELTRLFNNYFEFIAYKKQKTIKKKDPKHREIIKLSDKFFSGNKAELIERVKEENKKLLSLEKSKARKNIKDWKTSKIDWFRNKTKQDYLRLKGENIETSQGVRISITEAKRVLNLLDQKSAIGERINNTYLITSFKDFLKVGCHNISKSEIEYIRGLI